MSTKNLILTLIGVIATDVAHKYATAQRGYEAWGGEILILPFILVLAVAFDQYKEEKKEWKK